jgi:hypothetical protein
VQKTNGCAIVARGWLQSAFGMNRAKTATGEPETGSFELAPDSCLLARAMF